MAESLASSGASEVSVNPARASCRKAMTCCVLFLGKARLNGGQGAGVLRFVDGFCRLQGVWPGRGC